MSVQAAFFDFGGTLFSYREVQGGVFHPILVESLARLGVDAPLREAGRAWRRASASAFGTHHERAYYLHKDLFQETFRRFAEQVGGSANADDLEWFHESQRKMVHDAFALRPDCFDMLGELRARGIHTGIVSNIDDDYLLPMIERAGLAEHLDAWTSSEEARSCKPDAGIYRVALRKAGASADASVFVGDSPEHDIAGARRLGMHTILIRESDVETPGAGAGEAVEPHHVVAELGEVPEIVRGLGGTT